MSSSFNLFFSPPLSIVEGLVNLASWPEGDRHALQNALIEVKFPSTTKALTEGIAGYLSRSPQEIEDVIGLLKQIYIVFHDISDRYEQSKESLVKDFCSSIGERADVSEGQLTILESLLGNILNFKDSIGFPIRVTEIKNENYRNYLESRIITDMRPVFQEDHLSNNPPVTVILHNLRIRYMENGSPKEMFISLDDKDLEGLVNTINRAQDKEKYLLENLNQN